MSREAAIERVYVATGESSIHARVAGPPDAPPVVLLHQTASSSAMFEAMIGLLAPRFRVIAPDTPGFGQSAAPAGEPSVAGWARAINAALAELAIERALVFGHHTGASLAAELARAYPTRVSHLALSGPPLVDEGRRAALAATPPVMLSPDGSHLMAIWTKLRAKDPSVPIAVTHRELVLSATAAASWHLAYRAVGAHDLAACLGAVAVPTLVVAGDRDSLRDCVEPAAAALRSAPRVITATIPGAATYVCDTHAAELCVLLGELAR